MKKAPPFLKQYFWDIDFDRLDAKAHSRDISVRILEYGDEKAIKEYVPAAESICG